MKLRERRTREITGKMKDLILDSTLDINVLIPDNFFDSLLQNGYLKEELNYSQRYLAGKEFLYELSPGTGHRLTIKGYDDWLFPDTENQYNIFISYTTTPEDSRLADKVKTEVEKLGLNAFLAHKDITPGAQWRDKLISTLKSCGTFIALVTSDYTNRAYTNQECGFALALNKRILPIYIGVSPVEIGFISESQGKTFNPNEENDIIEFIQKQLGTKI